MKKRTRKQEAIYTLVFMLIVTVVCVAAVGTAYQLTKKKIKQNQTLVLKKAVLSAAGIALTSESANAIDQLYGQHVTPKLDSNKQVQFYRIKAGGFVIPQSGIGLWGTINSVIGFDQTGKKLTGIYFTDNNETPGLGKRIEETWFRTQFAGKTGPIEMLPPDTPTGENQFDAITGATITSEAVKTMVNQAFKKAANIKTELTGNHGNQN